MDYKAQGKANRAKGLRFEAKVRKELEALGWIVNKHANNISIEHNCFIQAKSNQFKMRQMGFPDFFVFMRVNDLHKIPRYHVKFIECKFNGRLSKDEKEKMRWLTEQGFECWTAYDDKRQIRYRKFMDDK